MLEKVRITAYNNEDCADSHQVGVPFIAMVNPESYSLNYGVSYSRNQGVGTSGVSQRYNATPPEDLSLEFLFDATGIIDGIPRNDVQDEVARFKTMLIDYNGDAHEPLHLKIAWGPLLFKGRCQSLNITYKLFNPDGKPIRAVCQAGFTRSIPEAQRRAEENSQSPDLTHRRIVKDGDTLPLLCYQIYGDSIFYLQVARANNLVNFRNLRSGQELQFPPVAKTTAS
jgi:hypothetical protein